MADRYNWFERWARSKIGPNEIVAYTGTSARTAGNKEVGFYRIVCTTDAFIQQGGATVVAVVTTSYPLFIGQEAYAQVDSNTTSGETPDGGAASDFRFAAIQMTSGGNMHVTLISRLLAATI